MLCSMWDGILLTRKRDPLKKLSNKGKAVHGTSTSSSPIKDLTRGLNSDSPSEHLVICVKTGMESKL